MSMRGLLSIVVAAVSGVVVVAGTMSGRSSPAPPEDGLTIAPAGHLGGGMACAAVAGGYAYLGQGGSLTVLDLAAMEQVGAALLPATATDLVVSGGLVYLVHKWETDLHVVDVADPTGPVIAGTVDMGVRGEAVAVAGGHAFVAAGSDGLRVVDVSLPSAPQVVGALAIDGRLVALDVGGDHAYLLESKSFDPYPDRLIVVGVADPANPVERGVVEVEDPEDVQVAGGYAYIAEGGDSNGLRVVDVSDPSSPASVAFLPVAGGDEVRQVAVAGDHACLGASGSTASLLVVDISDPAHPTQAGAVEVGAGRVVALDISGGSAYLGLSGAPEGWVAVDVSDPAQPAVSDSYASPQTVMSTVSDGSFLYVASREALWRYDHSDLDQPSLVGYDTQLAGLRRLAFDSGTVYGLTRSELQLVDVSDPGGLTSLGTCDVLDGQAEALGVSGDHVVLVTRSSDPSLQVVDVSDAHRPRVAGYMRLAGEGSDVAVDGHTAYVAYGDSSVAGLQVVDLSTPASPAGLGSVTTVGRPLAVWVENDAVFVGSYTGEWREWQWWLELFDVSEPDSPVQVAQASGDGLLFDIGVTEGRVFAGVYGGSVHVFDYGLAESGWFLDETATCPSESTIGITTTPAGLGTGGVYTTEGTFDFPEDPSGSEGLDIQTWTTGPPTEQCCLISSVAPVEALVDGCSAVPGFFEGECGGEVAVTATPSGGWLFDHWSGAASGRNQTTTAIMSGECSEAVAHFVPYLRLSAGPHNPGYEWRCPVREGDEQSELPIIQITLSASEADAWELASVGFLNAGNTEAEQVEQVRLRLGGGAGQVLATATYSPAITFSLSPPIVIPAGGAINVTMTYELAEKEQDECPDPCEEHAAYTNVDLIGAVAQSFPPGVKLPATPPPQTVFGGPLTVGCVQNVDTGACFAAIQPAVDAAADGHSILVCPGTYTENVDLTKRLYVQGIEGRRVTTVQAADHGEHVLTVTAEGTTIDGFTIQEASGRDKAGVKVDSGTCRVRDVLIRNNFYGIHSTVDRRQGAVIRGDNLEVRDNLSTGIKASPATVAGDGGSIALENVVVINNGYGGILAESEGIVNITGTNNIASDNAGWNGVQGNVVQISSVDASRNGGTGIVGKIVIVNLSVVANNNASNGIYGAVDVHCGDAVSVEVKNNGGTGIRATGFPSGQISVHNVKATGNQRGGLWATTSLGIGGDSNTISDNTGWNGVTGSWLNISSAEVSNNNRVGVAGKYVLIDDSISASDNAWDGIYGYYMVRCDETVTSLTALDNQRSGVHTTWDVGISVRNADARRNGNGGIRSSIGMAHVEGDRNVFTDNSGWHGINGHYVVVEGAAEASRNGRIGIVGNLVIVDGSVIANDNVKYGIYGRSAVLGENLEVAGNGADGIWSWNGWVSVGRIDASNNGNDGIRATGPVTIDGQPNVFMNNVGAGILSWDRVSIRQSALVKDNGGPGIRSSRGITGNGVRVKVNSGHGLRADNGNIYLADAVVEGNGRNGLQADQGSIDLSDAVVEFNAGDGVRAARDVSINTARICHNHESGIVAGGNIDVFNLKLCDNELMGLHIPPEEGGFKVSASSQDGDEGSTVYASTITGSGGDGVRLHRGAPLTVTGSAIHDNTGLGVNNLSPDVTIDASGNWWGDGSGPGGEGPGTGDEVSAGVGYDGWLGESIGVVVAPADLTVTAAAGEQTTAECFLRNVRTPDDTLDVVVTDGRGWVAEPSASTAELDPETGGSVTVTLVVPPGTGAGSDDVVTVTATSAADPSDSGTGTFQVLVRGETSGLVIEPSAVTLQRGEHQLFEASASDELGNDVPVELTWTSTAGAFLYRGVYLADRLGEHTVTATAGDLSGTATVTVVPPVVVRIEVSPEDTILDPNDSQAFTAMGYDAGGAVVPVVPYWFSDQGLIDDDGEFSASVEGDHGVYAWVLGVVGAARVHVGADADGDRVTDTTEGEAPNEGDGNGDGSTDSQQALVSSLPAPGGLGYLTVVSDCAGHRVNAFDERAFGTGDPHWSYPFGMVGVILPCESATVTVYLDPVESADGTSWRQHDRVTGTWSTLTGVTTGSAGVGAETIATLTLELTDGGPGDSTGADGQIVHLGGPALPSTLTVPVAAHLEGVGGTPWRSDCALSNPLPIPLVLDLEYRPSAAETHTTQHLLDPYGTILLEDLVDGTFGAGDGRGPLAIVRALPGPRVSVVSRTYAERSFGNLGQGIPAAKPLVAGAYLVTGLYEDDDYRSNIAVTAAEADVTVTFDLLRGDDGVVLEGVEMRVPAGTQQQWGLDNLFSGAARPGVPMAVRMSTSAPAIPYASLVDNASTDAVTYLAAEGSDEWLVPVVAHNPGQEGTFWRSDVAITSLSGSATTIEVEYLPEATDNSGGGLVAQAIELAAMSTTVIADVIGSVFGIEDGKGSLLITATGPVVATSRVYTNRAEGGTAGHGVPPVTLSAFSGGTRMLAGVRQQDGFRSNVGLVSWWVEAEVTLTLRDSDGTVLGTTSVTVPARSVRQLSVQGLFGGAQPSPVGAVEVSSTMPVLTYIAIVDPTSQDPAYVLQGR